MVSSVSLASASRTAFNSWVQKSLGERRIFHNYFLNKAFRQPLGYKCVTGVNKKNSQTPLILQNKVNIVVIVTSRFLGENIDGSDFYYQFFEAT